MSESENRKDIAQKNDMLRDHLIACEDDIFKLRSEIALLRQIQQETTQ